MKMHIIRLLCLIFFTNFAHGQGWKHHIIDNSSSGADGVKLADINEDGLLDITTGWEEGGLTKLYLHPGTDRIKDLWPNVIIGKTPNVEDAVFADMNDNGRLDIVSCTESNSEKIYMHFSPNTGFLNPEKWKQYVLPASDGIMQWMFAEPLQVDGKYGVDLVAAGKGSNGGIGWFEAPKKKNDVNGWNWHEISSMSWVMSIQFRDMDSDGDMDVIVTDRKSGLQGIRWLENPGIGKQQKEEWISHFVGGVGLEVMFMAISDLDGDSIEEVVVTERTSQTIRICKRKDKSGLEWDEHIIIVPATTGNCKSVNVGDINRDGVMDLVLSTNTDLEAKVGLTWLDGRNIKNSTGGDFHQISGVHRSKFDKVVLTDIDMDGDKDVLICEENYGENSEGLGVVWYENPFN